MSELVTPEVTKISDTNYKVSFGDDAKLYVEFYEEPSLMEFKSEQAGHPVYEPLMMIRIFSPGQPTPKLLRAQLTDLPNRKSDPHRFPAAWDAFKNKTKIVHEGLPVDMWPPITPTDVMNLKARNLHTVEQLAAVPDTMLEAPGFLNRQLREKAIVYLKSQGDGSVAMKLQAKVDAQDRTIEELKKSIEELKELNNKSEQQQQRKKAS